MPWSQEKKQRVASVACAVCMLISVGVVIGIVAAILRARVPQSTSADGPLYVWEQLSASGHPHRRAIYPASVPCPPPFTLRAPPSPAFPIHVCETPANRSSSPFAGGLRAVPHIVALGDTGCRRKSGDIPQDCAPSSWPFSAVAAAAAAAASRLSASAGVACPVVHAGDVLYRESTAEGWGDVWGAWEADFFRPAAPLLAATAASSPPDAARPVLVVVRGNHERCGRAAAGWGLLLSAFAFDPAWGGCPPPEPTWMAGPGVAVADTAAVGDGPAAPPSALGWGALPSAPRPPTARGGVDLMLTHRPAWAAGTAPGGVTFVSTPSVWAQASRVAPRLQLAGHLHSMGVTRATPLSNGSALAAPSVCVVVGHGGVALDPPTPAPLPDAPPGVALRHNLPTPSHGFALLSRVGVRVDGGVGVWAVRSCGADGACRDVDTVDLDEGRGG